MRAALQGSAPMTFWQERPANSSSTHLAHSGGTKLLPSHIGKLECLAPPRATQPACEAFFAPYERAAYPALLLPTPARLLHLHNFLLAAFQTHEPRYATYPISLNCIRRAIISDSPHAIRATSMSR